MPLHPTLAAIKRNLPSVARSLGFSARVTSGYRSTKKQAWLYDRYLKGLQSYPVAPPGTSDHEKGLALDIVSTNPDKLVSLMAEVGLSWAGPTDPVHFSLIGPHIAAEPQTKTFYQKAAAGAVRTAEILWTPPILKIADFFSDPIGTIKDNLATAFDVATWLA